MNCCRGAVEYTPRALGYAMQYMSSVYVIRHTEVCSKTTGSAMCQLLAYEPLVILVFVSPSPQARDVFGLENMADLRGSYGVGHVRYPTSGCNSVEEAQVNYRYVVDFFVEVP